MERVFTDAPDIIYSDSRYKHRHPQIKKLYNTFSSVPSSDSNLPSSNSIINIADPVMYTVPVEL